MINIRCELPDSLLIKEIVPFQGNLKKRTLDDIKSLAKSLVSEGLIMPFVIWNNNGAMKLLDGHGRLEALQSLCIEDTDIPEQKFPVLYIKADTEEEARKLLLQITSSYGKITKKGAVEFCKTIVEYHAPSIDKFIHKPISKRKLSTPKTESIIRISVPTEKVEELKQVLATVSFIKVL